jgi:hypothetical protein
VTENQPADPGKLKTDLTPPARDTSLHLKQSPEALVERSATLLKGMIKIVNDKANDTDARLQKIEKLELAKAVREMSEIIASLARRQGQATAVWNWHGMNAEQYIAAMTHLISWRDDVLKPGFPPTYRQVTLPCWYMHPDVVQLLGSMCLMWHWSHTDPDANPHRQFDWINRNRPELAKRIEELLAPCERDRKHTEYDAPKGVPDPAAEQAWIRDQASLRVPQED